jgi:glycosyltransferase involved in cell wall biosynthesis
MLVASWERRPALAVKAGMQHAMLHANPSDLQGISARGQIVDHPTCGTTGTIAMKGRPPVSVIISCWTEERLGDIRKAVDSLKRQTRPPEEIILVADGNEALYSRLSNEMSGIARVLLHGGLTGLSAARNAAVDVARGDLVAFLDDDAIALPNWLDELARPFADPRVVAVGGSTETEWLVPRPVWFPQEVGWVVGENSAWLGSGERELRNPHGNNMCFRKEAILEVGGFDVRYGRVGDGGQAGEEAEICIRIRQVYPDAKVLYAPKAGILHRVSGERANLRYLIRRSFQEGLAKARLSSRYRNPQAHVLATELTYLRETVWRGCWSRIRRCWHIDASAQLLTLLSCVGATAVGFAWGRLRDL